MCLNIYQSEYLYKYTRTSDYPFCIFKPFY